MSKQLRLDVAQLTDVGRKRPHNEDNMAYVIPKDPQVMAKKGALFIVADGMGGHAAGEVASEIAVDTVSNVYYQDDSEDVAVSLLRAIKRANSLINQRAAENTLRSGMGTTCVAAILRGNMGYIANVGDSRAYLVRGGQARQVSQDHSWVEEQVRAGLLTRDQARSHAQRNVITRCLGTQSEVEVDVFTEPLEEGDSLLLCTDGLSGLVNDDELRTIVGQYVPQEGVYHLVERANENGGPDNITAIVARVQEVGWEPPNARHPVHAGGREVGEDTAALIGQIPTMPVGVPAWSEDGHIPSASLRVATGALVSPDSVTAPQAVPVQKPKRNRLFYPLLTFAILLVLGLVGGGGYFFVLPRLMINVDASLANADSQVNQANVAIVAHNPGGALQKLAPVQTILHNVQNSSLTDAQNKQFNAVQDKFLRSVKAAITDYNLQASINVLPCTDTLAAPVNNGSTGTQATNIATVQDEKGNVLTYVLGEDYNLYQLQLVNQQQSLVHQQALAGPVKMIASNGKQILALTSHTVKGNTFPSYSLSLLTVTAGNLKDLNDTSIDTMLTNDGHEPKLITASGADVYVVLYAEGTDSREAIILDYQVSGDKLLGPSQSKISISKPLSSIAAFSGHQLFLLNTSGDVQYLQLVNGNQSPPPPVNVLVQHPIPSPLAISAGEFTLNMPVPMQRQFLHRRSSHRSYHPVFLCPVRLGILHICISWMDSIIVFLILNLLLHQRLRLLLLRLLPGQVVEWLSRLLCSWCSNILRPTSLIL